MGVEDLDMWLRSASSARFTDADVEYCVTAVIRTKHRTKYLANNGARRAVWFNQYVRPGACGGLCNLQLKLRTRRLWNI